MADAPAGGGGDGWKTIEIIIAIILGIALISQITGKRIVPVISPDSPTDTRDPASKRTEVIESDLPSCGLSIARPKPLEVVKSFVTLNGNTTGCGWEVKNGIALYAQVVDTRGKPISAYTPIPAAAIDANGLTTFSSTIQLTAVPTAGTGTLILVPAIASMSETGQTARIPIVFK